MTIRKRIIATLVSIPLLGPAFGEDAVAAETAQIFKNYEAMLKVLGSDRSDIVKCTVFLDDFADYSEMNKAYAAALPDPKPARSILGVDDLSLRAGLEIECVAIRRQKEN